MALSGRSGLGVTGATGDTLAAVDFNQLAKHGLAISRFMAERLGGEGLYSGGATVIGDIADGTDYPAFEAIVLDDSGNAWLFRTTSATEMTFSDTSGACTAYLVIGQVSGVSPAMATGGLTDFSIIVQLTATAAPAHSIPLGAGAVTASAFTDWTPDAGVNAGPAVVGQGLDVEGALTLLDGGSDHDITILRADVAAARSYTIPEAGAAADFVMTAGDQTVAGVKTFSSTPVVPNDSFAYAKLQNVSATDKLLGRSTAGAGDIEEIACTAAARSILDDATVSAIIATLFGTYVAETDYFATSTITGWAASPTGVIYYGRLGNVVTVNFYITGTSDNAAASFTLPYQLKTGISVLSAAIRVIDSGASQADAGHCYMTSGSATVTMTKTLTGTGFTASGTKTVSGQFRYFCNA